MKVGYTEVEPCLYSRIVAVCPAHSSCCEYIPVRFWSLRAQLAIFSPTPMSKSIGISCQPPDGCGSEITGHRDVSGMGALALPLRPECAGGRHLTSSSGPWHVHVPGCGSHLHLGILWDTFWVPLGANGRKPKFLPQEMVRLVKNIFKE